MVIWGDAGSHSTKLPVHSDSPAMRRNEVATLGHNVLLGAVDNHGVSPYSTLSTINTTSCISIQQGVTMMKTEIASGIIGLGAGALIGNTLAKARALDRPEPSNDVKQLIANIAIRYPGAYPGFTYLLMHFLTEFWETAALYDYGFFRGARDLDGYMCVFPWYNIPPEHPTWAGSATVNEYYLEVHSSPGIEITLGPVTIPGEFGSGCNRVVEMIDGVITRVRKPGETY